jgi:hypothetical protein
MLFLVLLLGALVLYAICWPTREGLEVPQNETTKEAESTLVLATQNEANLEDLKERMNRLMEIGDQMNRVQQACDANTENINTLVEQCK